MMYLLGIGKGKERGKKGGGGSLDQMMGGHGKKVIKSIDRHGIKSRQSRQLWPKLERSFMYNQIARGRHGPYDGMVCIVLGWRMGSPFRHLTLE